MLSNLAYKNRRHDFQLFLKQYTCFPFPIIKWVLIHIFIFGRAYKHQPVLNTIVTPDGQQTCSFIGSGFLEWQSWRITWTLAGPFQDPTKNLVALMKGFVDRICSLILGHLRQKLVDPTQLQHKPKIIQTNLATLVSK